MLLPAAVHTAKVHIFSTICKFNDSARVKGLNEFSDTMARLVTYGDSRPSMDHFGDTLVRDPYDTYDNNHAHEDNSTIASRYTSSTGVTVPEPKAPSYYGKTEAESLAAQFQQTSPVRRSNTVNTDKDSKNRLSYVDEEPSYYSGKTLPAIDEKQDAPLVYHAADMGSSGKYNDPGVLRPFFVFDVAWIN